MLGNVDEIFIYYMGSDMLLYTSNPHPYKQWGYRVSTHENKNAIYVIYAIYIYVKISSSDPIFHPYLPIYLPIHSNTQHSQAMTAQLSELPMHHHHSTAHKHSRKTP